MKGQIALWMLTKFAMVFFIFALALILVSVADRQGKAICEAEAQGTASSIAGAIVNVINSPVEDESKVVSLEAALSAGKEVFQKYTVSLKKREQGILVQVSAGAGCTAFGSAPFDKTTDVHLASMELTPSKAFDRTRYLVLVKCQPKTLAGGRLFARQVFFDNCKDPDVSKCRGLGSAEIDACCGWSGSASQAACSRAG